MTIVEGKEVKGVTDRVRCRVCAKDYSISWLWVSVAGHAVEQSYPIYDG